MGSEADSFLLLIVAIIFPPAAAAFVSGCGGDLCINILLTMLGYLPGCIHAFFLVIRRAEANELYGYKNWTYTGMGVYTPRQQFGPPRAYDQGPQAPPPESSPAAATAPRPSAPAPVDQKASNVPPSQSPPAERKYAGGTSGDQAPEQPPAY